MGPSKANDEERSKLKSVREKLGKQVGKNCDEWGCKATVVDGPLYRVNERGRPGIFMCANHRDQVESSHGTE